MTSFSVDCASLSGILQMGTRHPGQNCLLKSLLLRTFFDTRAFRVWIIAHHQPHRALQNAGGRCTSFRPGVDHKKNASIFPITRVWVVVMWVEILAPCHKNENPTLSCFLRCS